MHLRSEICILGRDCWSVYFRLGELDQMRQKWLTVALGLFCLSLLDGALTLRFGLELNPILSRLTRDSLTPILFLKLGLIPLFWFLGAQAGKNPYARSGLLFIGGWYSCIVTTELMLLYIR